MLKICEALRENTKALLKINESVGRPDMPKQTFRIRGEAIVRYCEPWPRWATRGPAAG